MYSGAAEKYNGKVRGQIICSIKMGRKMITNNKIKMGLKTPRARQDEIMMTRVIHGSAAWVVIMWWLSSCRCCHHIVVVIMPWLSSCRGCHHIVVVIISSLSSYCDLSICARGAKTMLVQRDGYNNLIDFFYFEHYIYLF